VLVCSLDDTLVVHVGCASQGLCHLEGENFETSLFFEYIQDLEVITVEFGFLFICKIGKLWIDLLISLINLSGKDDTHEAKETVLSKPAEHRHSHEDRIPNDTILYFVKH